MNTQTDKHTDRQTDRLTDRRTFRLIESIGPEGKCFEKMTSFMNSPLGTCTAVIVVKNDREIVFNR